MYEPHKKVVLILANNEERERVRDRPGFTVRLPSKDKARLRRIADREFMSSAGLASKLIVEGLNRLENPPQTN
jgi:hypothetical protein